MLVLSRRKNEALVIGDAVALRVMDIKKGTVQLRSEPPEGAREGGPRMSRRKNESFDLPGNVSVQVVDIQPDTVRLGITAPRDVPIYRREYYPGDLRPKFRIVPLKEAMRDTRAFLNDGQYVHLTDIMRRLQDWNSPEEISDLRIARVQGLWELKEKGGLLGRINVRVFFAVLNERREVVILGAFKKENEDQTPRHVVIRMRNRLRVYLDRHAQ